MARVPRCRAGPTFAYPQSELERLWKLVLLNQFHDVIPGSSIGEVYLDALEIYDSVLLDTAAIIDAAVASLGSGGGGGLLVRYTQRLQQPTLWDPGSCSLCKS